MKIRLSLQIIIGLALGFGIGLLYSWIISPNQSTDLTPASLRDDFKDRYRSAIASSYAATGDMTRAKARLALLEEDNPEKILAAQAQRMIGEDGEISENTIQALALLANALEQTGTDLPNASATPDTAATSPPPEQPTATEPIGEETTAPTPDEDAGTETVPTVPAINTATPHPAPTSTPLPEAPFALSEQETICDPGLAEGLLQIVVTSTANKQIPGVKISINWNNGEEYFFTGLKPEMGNGYADFVMQPGITYSISVGNSASPTAGLTPPACQTTDGDLYNGSLRLIFKQQ